MSNKPPEDTPPEFDPSQAEQQGHVRRFLGRTALMASEIFVLSGVMEGADALLSDGNMTTFPAATGIATVIVAAAHNARRP